MTDTIDFIPVAEGATRGTLCIRSEYIDSQEPVKHIFWYRIGGNIRRDEVEYWIGGKVQPVGPSDSGMYAWYGGYGVQKFLLENGGQTIAFKTEQAPIPKPRTRVETRWHWGRWEKYLKSKGWVPA